MTEILLEVEAIDVSYGPIQALRGLDLRVERGEMVALLGANGAGKSTTLRTVSGMIHPSSGSIRFEGAEIGKLPAHAVVRRGLAHLPEGRELFPNVSVEENLKAGYWVHRKEGKSFGPARDKVMDHFPILRERSGQVAGLLSGGEQQMLAVARALMSAPKLLVVDELSLGLAPMIVEQLFQILREINEEGTAVLIVEQFVHMALQNTNRAYVLAKGEVVLQGRSDELLASSDLMAAYLGESSPGASGEPLAGSGNGRVPGTRAAGSGGKESRSDEPAGSPQTARKGDIGESESKKKRQVE